MYTQTKKIAIAAVFAAFASIVMFLKLSLPIFPSFLTLNFSDSIVLLASFALGPIYGIAIAFIRMIISIISGSPSNGIGELCDFLLTISFILPGSILYYRKRTFKRALLGIIIGIILSSLMSIAVNYFIIYPVYINLVSGYTEEKLIGAFTKINKNIDTIFKGVIVFNLPFTLLKFILNSAIVLLIYKKVAFVIKKIARENS